MKTEENFTVIASGEGYIDFRLSGAAYRNLVKIAEAMDAVSWCDTDNTPETLADCFLLGGIVENIGEHEGAKEFAVGIVAGSIDTGAEDEAEDKRRHDELQAALMRLQFEGREKSP